MRNKRCVMGHVPLALVLLLGFFPVIGRAETINCTAITSLPYSITTQGIYCLTSDLTSFMTSGNAIEIDTNNVVIDLNGHKLGGGGAGLGTDAHGIYALSRKNITIRNGTVRGFRIGILLDDSSPYTTSQAHLIEDIRADINTSVGIYVVGQGNIIRNNQVVSTGGSTLNDSASGIVAYGPGARILNNDVIETKGEFTGCGIGIYLFYASGAVVENNRIGNSSLATGGCYGIYVISVTSTNVLVSNNRVTTMVYGVYYDPSTGSTGKYRDNLTSGVTTPYIRGTDAGGNN